MKKSPCNQYKTAMKYPKLMLGYFSHIMISVASSQKNLYNFVQGYIQCQTNKDLKK